MALGVGGLGRGRCSCWGSPLHFPAIDPVKDRHPGATLDHVTRCRGALGVVAVLAGAVSALGTGCAGKGSQGAGGCSKDTDCKGKRICVHLDCVEPGGEAVSPRRDGGAGPAPGGGEDHGVGAPFAMFGGDARHRGRLAGAAPAKAPTQQWAFQTAGPIVGSPIVGPDGTIYVGSHDGALSTARSSLA